MKRKINLSKDLFEKIFGKTSAEIKSIVSHISDVAYDEYDDVMEYKMANDGDMPSGDYFVKNCSVGCYVEYEVSDETAENLAYAANNVSCYEDFCKKLYSIPFSHLDKEFPNCYRISIVKEISKKMMENEFGGKIHYNASRINRPRFFKARYGNCFSRCGEFYMVQPDRKKSEYIVIRQYFMKHFKTGNLFPSGLVGPDAAVIAGKILVENVWFFKKQSSSLRALFSYI